MNFPILDIAQKTIPPTSNTKSTPISTKKITTPPHTQKKNSIAIIENELGLPRVFHHERGNNDHLYQLQTWAMRELSAE